MLHFVEKHSHNYIVRLSETMNNLLKELQRLYTILIFELMPNSQREIKNIWKPAEFKSLFSFKVGALHRE